MGWYGCGQRGTAVLDSLAVGHTGGIMQGISESKSRIIRSALEIGGEVSVDMITGVITVEFAREHYDHASWVALLKGLGIDAPAANVGKASVGLGKVEAAA